MKLFVYSPNPSIILVLLALVEWLEWRRHKSELAYDDPNVYLWNLAISTRE